MPESAIFPDVGLQLGVINALLELGKLDDQDIADLLRPVIPALTDGDDLIYDLQREREVVQQALGLLAALPLNAEDLQAITSLDFDGGNPIYMLVEGLLQVDTGGESDYYEVESTKGLDALTNLKTFVADGYASRADTSGLPPGVSAAR